jgi:glucose/mannose transport system substrate-binding protein
MAFRRTALACALVMGCASNSEKPNEGTPAVLDILTWLTTGTEKAALDHLLAQFRTRVPGAVVENPCPQWRCDTCVCTTETLVGSGHPPDTFQMMAGDDLVGWAGKNALESLDSLAKDQTWTAVWPTEVAQAVSRGSTLYAVPLDISRTNTLFYNSNLLGQLGLTPPKSLDDVFSAADALKSHGVTPFAFATDGGWEAASALWDSLFLALSGSDFYYQYLTGGSAADVPQVRDALALLARTLDDSNSAGTVVHWNEAVARVCDGQAAMLFMPDFAKPEFAARGCDGSMFGSVAIEPAGSPTFVFASTAWPLPVGAPHRDVALEFLKSAGSLEGQKQFSLARGSIPARNDVDPSLFDQMSWQAIQDYAGSAEHRVLAYETLTPRAFQEAVSSAMKAFTDPTSATFKNVDAVVAALNDNYALLHP